MSENRTNSNTPMEQIQNISPETDGSDESNVVNNSIASVSNNTSSEGDKVVSDKDLGEETLSNDGSDCGEKGMSTDNTTQQSGPKRKRDTDDVGGSSNRESADVCEIIDWIDMSKDTTSEHKCWIKWSHDYRATQIRKIQAKHNAAELVRCMNDNGRNLRRYDDVHCYGRWWLAAATKYNHIALVSLILADRMLYDLNYWGKCPRSFAIQREDLCHFGRPFYMAIEQGQLSLVRAFLLAGPAVVDIDMEYDTVYHNRVRSNSVLVRDASCLKYIHEDVSALEYAFMVNQPEVVTLLLDHFNSQHTKRDYTADTSPLHAVVNVATQFYGPHLIRLPALVQQIIAAGEDANRVDQRGYTPLELLMKEIRLMVPLDEDGTMYRHTLMEITKILLTSGSTVDVTVEHCRFEIIPKLSYPPYMYFDSFPHATLSNHIQFVCDLARLLLLKTADLTLPMFYMYVPNVAAMVLYNCRGERDVCDKVLISLSNMIRMAIFEGANNLSDYYWESFINNPWFISTFVQLAEYSSKSGHAAKLMFMMLNALSARNVRKLTNMLQNRQEYVAMHSNPLYSVEDVNDAIRYAEGFGAPRSLKDLSRQAITRAISMITLLGASSVYPDQPRMLKCLPPMLEAFVLLK